MLADVRRREETEVLAGNYGIKKGEKELYKELCGGQRLRMHRERIVRKGDEHKENEGKHRNVEMVRKR